MIVRYLNILEDVGLSDLHKVIQEVLIEKKKLNPEPTTLFDYISCHTEFSPFYPTCTTLLLIRMQRNTKIFWLFQKQSSQLNWLYSNSSFVVKSLKFISETACTWKEWTEVLPAELDQVQWVVLDSTRLEEK